MVGLVPSAFAVVGRCVLSTPASKLAWLKLVDDGTNLNFSITRWSDLGECTLHRFARVQLYSRDGVKLFGCRHTASNLGDDGDSKAVDGGVTPRPLSGSGHHGISLLISLGKTRGGSGERYQNQRGGDKRCNSESHI